MQCKGFTLLEVMVGLIISVLVIGGVMGLLSSSFNYSARVQRKSLAQPVLDAAAERIMAKPELALEGSVQVGNGRDAPTVRVLLLKVENPDVQPLGQRQGELYQIKLSYADQSLEFSVIIPKPKES